MVHPHLSDLRPDEDGSPWRLMPAVIGLLAVLAAVMITVSFLVADLLAGKAY